MNQTQHPLLEQARRVRQPILDDVHSYEGGLEMTPRTRGFICRFINDSLTECGADSKIVDDWRYLVFTFLFSSDLGVHEILSSKLLTEAHLYALYEWAQPYKNEDDGIYRSANDDFLLELTIVYNWVKSRMDALAEEIGWTE